MSSKSSSSSSTFGRRQERRCRLPFLLVSVASSFLPSPDVVVVDGVAAADVVVVEKDDFTNPSLNPRNSNNARGNRVWYNLRVVLGSKSPQIRFLLEPKDLRNVDTEVYLAAHSALRRS